MTRFVLKERKYGYGDFLYIPLTGAPVVSALRVLLKLAIALVPVLSVAMTAMFIDRAIAIFSGIIGVSSIYLPLGFIMVMTAVTCVNGAAEDMLAQRFNIGISEHFRPTLVDKRARMQYQHIESNDSWELINRVCADPGARVSNGFNAVMNGAALIVTVVSLLSVIMAQVWWAGLAILAFAAPLFYVAFKAGKNYYEADKEAKKHSRRAEYLMKVIIGRENVEERALFSYADDVNEKWYEKYEIARKISYKVNAKEFIKRKGGGLITLVISAGIIAILILPLGEGGISVGMFIALVTATLNLVQQLSWTLTYVTGELAQSREYLKDLTAFAEMSEQDGACELPDPMQGFVFDSIEFKGVSFKYPNTDRYILKNFSTAIKSGRHYAFVGVNGAGKTTITKLLCGMYDNYEGDILINGKSLREYTLLKLKGIFSIVYQDFAKYYVKLKDNILLGDLNISDENGMREIIDTMELSEVVDKLPQGVDTYLGKIKENGTDISGGEWQRLAIARALYAPKHVRILDEPTAALDPIAESKVYNMFGKISAGRTTIFITHRLGAARLADEIIVLKDGYAAEIGSHDELMARNGIYAGMFEAQRSWYA